MPQRYTALVGLHHPRDLETMLQSLKILGYDATSVSTLPDMLRLAGETEFDSYVMDVNLGYPDTVHVEPAKRVYDLVRQRVEEGEAIFLAISANIPAVRMAQRKEIPCERKANFPEIMNALDRR